MLKILIEKEIRDLIGSTKFAVTFGVCALLIIATFYVGAIRYKLNVSQYEASRSEIYRAMEGITDWIDVDETSILLPPQKLDALVSGVTNDINRTAHITGRGSIPTEDSRYGEDPIFATFRFIDLEFIFAVVLSLFAILLGYDTISGEKERGTLKLTFANPVPRQTYILGKLLGSLITLAVTIILALAIGSLLLMIMGINLSGDEWIRLMLIIIAGLMFISLFLILSIFISTVTHRSANSFLILLVIWVLCIHIIPRASVLLAARSVNVIPEEEIAYQKSVMAAQLREEFGASLLKLPAVPPGTPPEKQLQAINEYMDSLSNLRWAKMNALSSRLEEQRHNSQRVQEKLAMGIARVSPVTSFTLAITNLAGTSTELKDRFYDEAMRYQEQFGAFIKEKTGTNLGTWLRISATVDDGSEPAKPEPINPREMPAFEFNNRNRQESIEAAMTDMGLLALFNIIFFAGAFVAFLRYDVR